MTHRESSVLEAAKNWVFALEAHAEAEHVKSGQRKTEAAFREAEVHLYAAVIEWRSR